MKKTIDKSAFTLVELLVTIGIIAILAAILLPAMNSAFSKAESAKAQSEVKSIETAAKQYLNEYSKFPHGSGNSADYNYGGLGGTVNNEELMNVLRSVNGTGNNNFTNNPRKIVFLEISEDSLSTNNFVDPWGSQYEVTVDTGFDNICDNMAGGYGAVTGRNVVVWSCGPDGSAKTSDDIKSWK